MIEHLAGKMLEAAGARRAEVQLAGIRLRITDKFPDVVRGERRINVDRIKQGCRLGDTPQVFRQIVRQALTDCGIYGMRCRNKADRVAVVGMGGDIDADGTGRAGAIIDYDLLPPQF